MRAGFVATVRVNPKDCMGIIDACQKAGMNPYDMSFSGCVSLVLASLLENIRTAGVIPERDGFEYGRMMGPFEGGKATAGKRAMTNALYTGGAMGLSPPKVVQDVLAQTKEVEQELPLTEWESLSKEERTALFKEMESLSDRREGGEGLGKQEEERYWFLNNLIFTQ